MNVVVAIKSCKYCETKMPRKYTSRVSPCRVCGPDRLIVSTNARNTRKESVLRSTIDSTMIRQSLRRTSSHVSNSGWRRLTMQATHRLPIISGREFNPFAFPLFVCVYSATTVNSYSLTSWSTARAARRRSILWTWSAEKYSQCASGIRGQSIRTIS